MYQWGVHIPVNGVARDGSPITRYEIWFGAATIPNSENIAAIPVEAIDELETVNYTSSKLLGQEVPQYDFGLANPHTLRIRGIMPRNTLLTSMFGVFWESLRQFRLTGEPFTVLQRDQRFSGINRQVTRSYTYRIRRMNLQNSIFRSRRGQLLRWQLEMFRVGGGETVQRVLETPELGGRVRFEADALGVM